MIIYTSHPRRQNEADAMVEHNVGMMFAPYSNWGKYPQTILDNNLPIAVDNGAYGAFLAECGFDEFAFLKLLHFIRKNTIKPAFVVCPDIVKAGYVSLEFSYMWQKRLVGWPLYLAVQNGMNFDIALDGFQGIFVGGDPEWKWDTAEQWIYTAHKNNLKCHIAKTPTFDHLCTAFDLGADSCDSTYFQRHNTWEHIIDFKLYRNQAIHPA
jgi:hypothetical protein